MALDMFRASMKSDFSSSLFGGSYRSSYDDSTSTTPANSLHRASGAKPAVDSQFTGTEIPRRFPQVFHLFSQSFGQSFYLGESQSCPIYAVSTHEDWSGNPNVVLHAGPSKHDATLAAAESTSTIPPTLMIRLPALPRSQKQASMETLVEAGSINRRYRFSIEVGEAGAVREEFEWRRSSGAAIKDYAGARQGWKLMRMTTGPPGSGKGGYTSSDGKEVVAVWAKGSSMSMTKSLCFAFIGAGASGALGQRWALMAVMTALLMWEQEQQARAADFVELASSLAGA